MAAICLAEEQKGSIRAALDGRSAISYTKRSTARFEAGHSASAGGTAGIASLRMVAQVRARPGYARVAALQAVTAVI